MPKALTLATLSKQFFANYFEQNLSVSREKASTKANSFANMSNNKDVIMPVVSLNDF